MTVPLFWLNVAVVVGVVVGRKGGILKHFAFFISTLVLGLALHIDATANQTQTVGDEITTKIKLLVSNCMGPDRFKNNFIPEDFLTDPQISAAFNEAAIPADVSFKRLATRIFGSSTTPTIAGINALEAKGNTLYLNVPEAVPMTDSTNVIYSLGCSSSLKLALEQGFSLPWPLGATDLIKQSLNAEASGGRNSKLLIMYGDFKNPIASLLSPTAVPIDARVGAYAAVWRFMLDNSFSSLTSPGKYISTMRGWVVTNSSLEELSGVLNANAGVNVSALLFNANLSGQTSYQYSSKYSSNIYRIYFNPVPTGDGNGNNPDLESGNLPAADSIISVIDAAADVSPSNAIYLPRSPVAIRAVIPGLSQQSFLCAKDWWKISSSDPDVLPSGDNPASVTAKLLGNGDCQLDGFITIQKPGVNTIHIVFKNTGYPIVADSVTKTLSVTRAIPATAESVPTAYFLTQPIANLVADSVPPVYSIKTSLSYFSKGSFSNMDFSGLKINCPPGGVIPNIANIDPVPHGERFLSDLTITAGALSNSPPDWSTCVLEGDVLSDYAPPDGGTLAKGFALHVKSLAIGIKQ